MLTMFVVLEGFDIGAGMLQYVVGKTEAERRTVIAAIGPLWSWHEVWLVGFGGRFCWRSPQ
jgi:cytochrome d ubiquinol oxidase subunit II